MIKNIKTTTKNLALALLLLGSVQGQAQSTVTLDPSLAWLGYMNVFNLPSAGGGFQFGSGWGTADLTATFAGSVLTLGPNTIGDPNPYWYTPAGGPGATGNKVMDANMYVETTGLYVNQTLTFTGNVLTNTLAGQTAAGNGVVWSTVAFIKDFAPDYSSFTTTTVPLTPGIFSISMLTGGAGDHVQFGFETIGSDVWVTDVGQYGTAVIIPVPEPSTLAMSALGGLGIFSLMRFRKK